LNGFHQCEVHVEKALDIFSALNWINDLYLGMVEFELDFKKVADIFLSFNVDFGVIIKTL